MPRSRRLKIWLLMLVPKVRFGRWWSALAILLVGGAVYGTSAISLARNSLASGLFPWSVTLFFVTAVAYIVPMFHYITERTHIALDRLGPYVDGPERLAELHDAIEKRPIGWTLRTTAAAVLIWLVQSRLLSGSWEAMWDSLGSNYVTLSFSLGPLFVWLAMTATMSALLHNALTMRRLVPDLATDILEPDSYMPIGSMAVTSTLVVLGATALLSVMWMSGPIDWWTTLPALLLFGPLVVLLLLLPVWPLHRRLMGQRQAAVAEAQDALRSAREDSSALSGRAAALTLRRELARLPVWPFDISAVVRFISYAIIVPTTWAGAALIEMLVDALLQ